MRFSSRLFKSRVTFAKANYGRAARGASQVTGSDPGPRVPAYIETLVGAPIPGEAAEQRPIGTTHWRIFTQVDPDAGLPADPVTGLPRRLTAYDLAYCEIGNGDGTYQAPFLVQLDRKPPAQPPLWCAEGDEIGGGAVTVPTAAGADVLLMTGGNLQLMSGAELTFAGTS